MSGLLPTPAASEYGSSQNGNTGPTQGNRRSPNLGTAVHQEQETWPTPGAARNGPDFARAERDGAGGDSLETAVVRRESWRTPTKSDSLGGASDPARRTEAGHTLLLKEQVWEQNGGGSLNPTWVEALMGYPPGWTDLGNEELRGPSAVDSPTASPDSER